MTRPVAIVTGSSKGIGLATVRLLKEKGYATVGVSRSGEGEADVELKADVSSKEDVRRVIDYVVSKYGRLDVVVNNAGFGVYGYIWETPLEEEEYEVKTLFLGVLYFTKFALPVMIKQGRGSIVNVASQAAYVSMPTLLVYSSMKAAVAHFTNGLWASLKGTGVRVSGVYPGPVRTSFTSHPSFKGTEPKFNSLAVEPERVAKAIWKAIRTGKREIYVPSRLVVEPYFLKLGMAFQSLTYSVQRAIYGKKVIF
ncbi:MAG: SDR family NAD(P)-dependent oxidoreductase [Thermoprotei archaeon]